ncbi:MAG: hypothetical protein ACTS10_10955 [Kiloniellales bacterium]
MTDVFSLNPIEEDRIAFNPIPTTPGDWGETFSLWNEAGERDWFNSRHQLLRSGFSDEIQRVRDLTGEVVRNPITDQSFDWDSDITRLRQAYPSIAGDLRTREQIENSVYERVQELAQRQQEQAMAAAPWTAQIAGSLFAGLRDPLTLLTAPIGLGAGGAKTAIGAVVRVGAQESALNAALQIASEATNADFYRQLGIENDPLANVAMAAAGGAVLGGGVRGLMEGLGALGRRLRPSEQAAERVLERAILDQRDNVRAADVEVAKAYVERGQTPPAAPLARVDQEPPARAAPQARAQDSWVPVAELYRGGDVASAANRDFVQGFARTLPEEARQIAFGPRGGLTREGAAMAQQALMSRAYGDDLSTALRDLSGDEAARAQALPRGLQDVSGRWSAMREASARGDIDPQLDITDDLGAAVRAVQRARQEGLTVGQLAERGDLFDLNDRQRAALGMLVGAGDGRGRLSRAAVRRRMDAYLDEAMASRPGTRQAEESRTIFETEAERRAVTVEQVRTTTEVPADDVASAAEIEAQRIAAEAEPQVPTPILNAEGEVIDYRLVPASEVLEEGEQAVTQAAEIAACLVGSAA